MKSEIYSQIVSNESLEAIIKGLNISKYDSVLAICGSGDQAIAIYEKAGKVTVIDNDESQLKCLLEKKGAIELGRFDEFFNLNESCEYQQDFDVLFERNEYFSKRLNSIKRKLKEEDSFVTIIGNVFTFNFKKTMYNKIYLSNALSFDYLGQDYKIIQGRLKRLTQQLNKNGLIYISDGKNIMNTTDLEVNPIGLKVNHQLTVVAQKLQFKTKYWYDHWLPFVFEKI